MIRPWKRVGSRPVGDYQIFSLRADRVVSPRTGQEHEFYAIECVDWVNVIAVTSDDHLVLVQQYRHGSNTIELEIPGGMMDAHDASPVEAGVRELREETGYAGDSARVIGRVYPNPALQTNTCHTILVQNCSARHERKLDHGEDLATRLVPCADLPRLVAEGQFGHSLVIVALYYYDLLRRGLR
jgi:8-oxo-dGTP pyrophosphatase MutT (NUDIX family)